LNKKYLISTALLLGLLAAQGQAADAQVSGTTIKLKLQDSETVAEVSGLQTTLATAPVIVDDSFYVPIRWVSEQLGMTMAWKAESRRIGLTAPHAYIEWDLNRATASVNGISVPLEETSIIQNDSLLVKLSWIAPYMGVTYVYQPNPSRVELTYTGPTKTAYRESVYTENIQPNSRPIAKFVTDKAEYRKGEPVAYVDLSYDADAEGLPEYRWIGQKDAFFEPGTHAVTLQVRDGSGLWSEPFTQSVKVTNDTFLTEEQFPWYAKPVGTLAKLSSAAWKRNLTDAPAISSEITERNERLQVVSGVNHTIGQSGLLKKQTINGKVRLYSHHVLGVKESKQFAILLHNPNPTETRHISVSKQGMGGPTLFHGASAASAVASFMTEPALDQSIEVKPGETVTLQRYTLQPGQGFIHIKDMESDGPLEAGFVVTGEFDSIRALPTYAAVTDAVVASSTGASEVKLQAYVKNLTAVSQWTTPAPDATNIGTVYKMRMTFPSKAAIGLRAPEGLVNGTLKVNGKVMQLPEGGLTEQDGALLIYRSTGLEAEIAIEWMAAPGSTSSAQWIYYPLEEKR
jgi:hypothetical protein